MAHKVWKSRYIKYQSAYLLKFNSCFCLQVVNKVIMQQMLPIIVQSSLSHGSAEQVFCDKMTSDGRQHSKYD